MKTPGALVSSYTVSDVTESPYVSDVIPSCVQNGLPYNMIAQVTQWLGNI